MFTTTQNSVDRTVRIFDNFYTTATIVNGADYDVVYSFFRGVTNNKRDADTFTALIFRISQAGKYNVMSLLENLKSVNNKLELNQVISYYLNTFKSKVSLYGIGSIPKPNEAVQRNIVL